MATKRMPTASASRRAIVVLPVPGGPHRIIEASLPAATIRPIAPSGAGQMLLADDLVELLRPQPVGERRILAGAACAAGCGGSSWKRSATRGD